MTVQEAAQILEVRPGLIYALCSAGLLAHRRVGLGRGLIRIDRPDLDAYIASSRVECRTRSPGQPPRSPGLAVRDIIGEMEAEEARKAESAKRRRKGAAS